MRITLTNLSDIDPQEIVALLTHPLVRRHMPLAGAEMSLDEARAWAAGKDQQWVENGYGPWAFVVDDEFVGWGGLQKEGGEPDLGLVLHPDHWGKGRAIAEEIIRRAFGELGFESVTILLPPSRTRVKGVLRLGFVPDGEVDIDGERFVRYRLWREQIAK
jgi:RimJ/RimL family protein N-acetyltransferase